MTDRVRRTTRRPARVPIRTAAAVLCVALLAAAAAGRPQLVLRRNSLYQQILVYRDGPVVTLRFRKRETSGKQSEVDLSNMRRHCLEYSKLAFGALLYRPEPARVLVVGLGGGTIPRDMHHYLPEAQIDVVEIDPEVEKIAKDYFGFRTDEKLRVHISDGRMFIRRLLRQEEVERYDIVILDAFTSDYIPFHLMTREFLEEVKQVLADDGILAANVWSTNRLYDAELRTFLEVFERCQGFYGKTSSNAILIAPGPEAELLTLDRANERAAELQERHEFAFDMRWVATRVNVAPVPAADARALTDDRAPVHWLREQPRDD